MNEPEGRFDWSLRQGQAYMVQQKTQPIPSPRRRGFLSLSLAHLAGVTSTTLLQPLAWICDTMFCMFHTQHASRQRSGRRESASGCV